MGITNEDLSTEPPVNNLIIATNPREFSEALNDKSPSRQLARIRREQYEDYLNRFVPIEDILFQTQGEGYAAQQGALSREDFLKGFQGSQQSAERELQAFGIQQTEEQKRLAENEKNLGALNAENRGRRQAVDAGQAILGLGTRGRIIPE